MSESPTHTREGDVYEVFATPRSSEPLHHVGSVIAVSPRLAGMYAYALYDEWGWSEMIIVPRAQIKTLVAPA